MAKVKISVDSASDLAHMLKERDISSIPLFVQLGDKNLLDGVTVTPQDIYKYFDETSNTPKTAANNPENFREYFESLIADGSEVVHFSISSEMSMMHTNATLVANELGGIHVVDSRNLSTGIGLLALYAADLRDEGLSAAEIAQKAQARVGDVQASFVIDKLKFLHKGGRCNGVTMFISSVLKIKPTILVKDGVMGVGKKYIGSLNKSVEKYAEDILEHFDNPDLTRVFITHSTVEAEVLAIVRETIKKKYNFKEIIVTTAGATITSHCGKGTLGILYINGQPK